MKQSDIWNKRFDDDKGEERSSYLEKYIQYFIDREGKQILDLGCGDGGNALYLESIGLEVVAADFSQSALNIVKSRSSTISTCCFDMTNKFPFDPETFDFVVASLSTHYFSFQDTLNVYEQIWSVLKPNGYLFFRVNSIREYLLNKKNDTVEIIEPNYYLSANGKKKRYFTIETIKEMLHKFHIEEIYEDEFRYKNNKKYAISGVARKIN